MNIVNHAMPQGMGLGQFDRLSQIPTDRMPPRPEQDLAPRNPHQIPADEVRLSDWARSFVATPLIYLPPPNRPGGDSYVASSMRLDNGRNDSCQRVVTASKASSSYTRNECNPCVIKILVYI